IGVYLAYVYFGNTTGSIVLVGTLGLSVGTAIYSFRTGVWDRFANKSKVEGRVNSDPLTIAAGDVGETISVLRPIGKAEFGNKLYEVRTLGNYVEAGEKVKITHIDHTKIFVEPLTE
ncbi:MAG: NfeD family protein, partial [Bacteroidota bacterium]